MQSLPLQDPVPFHEEHELVYAPQQLDDTLDLIDGLCSVVPLTRTYRLERFIVVFAIR